MDYLDLIQLCTPQCAKGHRAAIGPRTAYAGQHQPDGLCALGCCMHGECKAVPDLTSSVFAHVPFEPAVPAERLPTLLTLVGFFTCVNTHV